MLNYIASHSWEIRNAKTWQVIVTDFCPRCEAEKRMIQKAMQSSDLHVIEINE